MRELNKLKPKLNTGFRCNTNNMPNALFTMATGNESYVNTSFSWGSFLSMLPFLEHCSNCFHYSWPLLVKTDSMCVSPFMPEFR